MRLSIVTLVLAAAATAGCPVRGRCPIGEDESPSVSAIVGSMDVTDESGTEAFVLTTSSAECWLRPTGEILEEGEDEAEGMVRPVVRIECNTNQIPLLVVRLPDVRGEGVVDGPVELPVDVTFAADSFGAACTVTDAERPSEVSIFEAVGGADPTSGLVSDDYLRDFETTVHLDAGTRVGTRADGTMCQRDVPALDVTVRVTMDASDIGNDGGGCG